MLWNVARIENLDPRLLYNILKLRSEVFVVEQNCVYLDADDKDFESLHLFAYEGGNVHAYARLLKPGVSYAGPSIGRVVVAKQFRGTGLGKELMLRALDHLEYLYPGAPVTISAQCYLERFYNELGFRTASDPYPEDEIPHIKMIYSR